MSLLRSVLLSAAVLLLYALPASAHPAVVAHHPNPGPEYKQVSKLVPLPDFVPGLGELFVNPKTLPAGPFLAYDHHGKLVSTVYMIPLKDMNEHKSFNDLAVAPGQKVDHVDIYFNAGHPGVAEPHYHVVLWYVSRAQAEALK
jgi:hypothetical protein